MVDSTGPGTDPGNPGAAGPADSGSGDEPAAGHRPGTLRAWRFLAVGTVAFLLVATVAAFGYSQRLKREPLLIDRVEFRAMGAGPDSDRRTVFSPNGDCHRDRMTISFRTTRSDDADVEIIGPGGKPVRLLVRNRFFKRYREHRLVWDGRKNSGRIPQTGRFRVRVIMHSENRVLYLPGFIRLHRFPPRDSACPDPDAPGAGRSEQP